MTGTTYGGRDIIALQVTKDATGSDIPDRPAVLYNAMQHAREWLAGETCRRTLDYFVGHYGKGTSAGKEATKLVDNTELWFVCVNNPDGYEYTFTPGQPPVAKEPRRQRRQQRDRPSTTASTRTATSPRTGAATTTAARPTRGSETYRGPGPASEPETQAMEALFAEINPVFQKNDHTAASLLLYPQGVQQDTPSADHEIFTALAGDPFKPGIPGFIPELSAALYITNGDFTDWAYNTQDTLSFTPEGTPAEDPNVTGFEYPDSPLQIQQEFERHLPFALDLAHSADDPANPHSHLDNTAADFTVDKFKESYGSPQPVGAVVKRELGEVKMRYSINGEEGQEGLHRGLRGRRALLPGARRLLPPRPRRREGNEPGRRGRGLVHGGRREVQVLHLRGRGRIRQPGADPLERGLLGRAAESRPRARAELPRLLRGRAGRGRGRLRRLRRGRARPPASRSARGPGPLLACRLVHGRRLRAARARCPRRLGDHQACGGHAERGARLHQRRRQALLHGHERRPGVRRGLRLQPVPARGGHLLPERQPELHPRPGRLPPVLARRLPLRRRRGPRSRRRLDLPGGGHDRAVRPALAYVQRGGFGAER